MSLPNPFPTLAKDLEPSIRSMAVIEAIHDKAPTIKVHSQEMMQSIMNN